MMNTPNGSYYAQMQAVFDTLVSLNRDHRQSRGEESRRCRSMAEYMHEMCTLRIDLGRMTGKTHWVMTRATKDDIVIFANPASRDRAVAALSAPPTCVMAVGIEQALHEVLVRRFDKIYINEPSFLFKNHHDMREFCGCAAKDYDQTMIVLGA